MDNTILQIVMRVIHIVSAITAVGGLMFAMICVKPAVRVIEDTLRESVLEVLRKRFHKVLFFAIVGLVVSGAYNWVLLAGTYKAMGPIGNALIGTKVLLALIMFAVVWARASGIIKVDKVAQMINIHLAAIVIILAAVLRTLRLAHGAG